MAVKRVFKSKKKLSSTRAVYRPWRDWEVGDYLIGVYKGSQIDNYEKSNWLIEVEEAVFVKDKKDAKALVGKVIGLNSNGKLDKAMESAVVGQILQVTYNGMSEIEKGKYKGKEAHDVEVELMMVEGEDEDEEVDEDEDDSDDSDDDDDL